MQIRILLVSLSEIWATSVQAVLAALPDCALMDTVKGGLTAYDVIRRAHPDLVIVDATIPLDEQVRLLMLLRDLEARPFSIVVMATNRDRAKINSARPDLVVFRADSWSRLIEAVHVARAAIHGTHQHNGELNDLLGD